MKFLLLNFILLLTTFAFDNNNKNIPIDDFIDNYKLSMISYCNKESILQSCGEICEELKIKKKITYSDIFYDSKLNILMWFFDTEKDGIHLVFRGTQMKSVANWIENLHVSQDLYICLFSDRCCHHCKVHTGFLNMLEWIEDKLHSSDYWQKFIRDTYSKNKKINIIGHSLGGALATIVSIHYLNLYESLNQDNIYVYTFGSPRVGNLNFSMYFEKNIKNTYRIVNRYDIIPHLPPNIKFLDHFPEYIHVGNEYWVINDVIKLCVNTNNEFHEDFSCSFNAEKTLLNDHYYFFNLENKIKILFEKCIKST
jgi:predicted lipase